MSTRFISALRSARAAAGRRVRRRRPAPSQVLERAAPAAERAHAVVTERVALSREVAGDGARARQLERDVRDLSARNDALAAELAAGRDELAAARTAAAEAVQQTQRLQAELDVAARSAPATQSAAAAPAAAVAAGGEEAGLPEVALAPARTHAQPRQRRARTGVPGAA